jgi:carotenoid cleavage dioxygenase
VEPCYVFHPLNAYEDGDAIVLEVIRHEKVFERNRHGASDSLPTLARWTVEGGKVREESLDDRAQEFPRIDERRLGRRHRYGYAVGIADEESTPSDAVFRHDLARGTTTTRALGKGRQTGEFVFEPRTPGAAEDDGVLMGFVYDAATERSDLMILDAASLETVAAIHLPDRVPHGFHGNWIPS